MMKKIMLIALMLCWLAGPVWADDADIYGIPSGNIPPNVLIILDNSGSMETRDVDAPPLGPYNPDTVYPVFYTSNKVYYDRFGEYKSFNRINLPSSIFLCAEAENDLTGSTGRWTGKIEKTGGKYYCNGSGTRRRLALGNYLNYLRLSTRQQSRMQVAKQTIAEFIYNNHDAVHFGLMRFDFADNGGLLEAECGASQDALIGSFNPDTSFMLTHSQPDFGAVGRLNPATYTALTKTLAEAGLYFAGETPWYLKGVWPGTPYRYNSPQPVETVKARYTSPIQWRCQKNYIILMTDGEPTRDFDCRIDYGRNIYSRYWSNYSYTSGYYHPWELKTSCSNTAANYLNNKTIKSLNHSLENGSYLDDVAYFLANEDLLHTSNVLQSGGPGNMEDQNVTTHTIGFKANLSLLEATATNGGGQYFTTSNASQLAEALQSIINFVYDDQESFSAATVPVSRANKSYAGNYVYFGLFQPKGDANWTGNIKKYQITNLGVIKDKDGNNAVLNGQLVGNATSYWSQEADGENVEKGGVGAKLVADLKAGVDRKVYTYTGAGGTTLTNPANSFSVANLATLQAKNNALNAGNIAGIRQENLGDEDWPLGSFYHSQPIVVRYGGASSASMIFAGGNDGMMHCFDDEDGSEKWGYIPSDILEGEKLSKLPNEKEMQYFVDGSSNVYEYDANKKLLVFGERRGGYSYTALDISDYQNPKWAYEINRNLLDGNGDELLGQSWDTPELSKIIGSSGGMKDVFIMGGGYDTNQDEDTPAANDDEGRAVFAVDAKTGELQTGLNFNHSNFSEMTHSIVAVSGFENPKSRTVTRVYAGDMNGNLFAFRDDVFDSDPANDGAEDGNWQQKLKLYSSPGKKIFYPPNIVNISLPVALKQADGSTETVKRTGDFVFYGTGDRANPLDRTTENEFYAIRNNWDWQSETPEIVKAYVDPGSGEIKDKESGAVIVGRSGSGADSQLNETASALYILDATDDLIQDKSVDKNTREKYVYEATMHSANRGWYMKLDAGEKVVSTPIIYNGVVYFASFAPDPPEEDPEEDPCAGTPASGENYIYAVGFLYGEAVKDFDSDDPGNGGNDPGNGGNDPGNGGNDPGNGGNDPSNGSNGDDSPLDKNDRKKELASSGIAPNPVLVVHEGKPTILIGPEGIDPVFGQGVIPFYWRELNN